MTKTMMLALAGAIAMNGAAFCAVPSGVTLSADNRIVHAGHAVRGRAAAPPKAGRVTIFDNFASLDPLGVYMVGTGYTLTGPNSGFGQNWLAAAFTPSSSTTLTEVQAAVGYIQGAKSAVTLNIYADASGVPGTLLWSGRAKMPVFGDCCAVASAHDGAGLPLTAGTQYWLGVTTLADDADVFAAWSFNVADQITPGLTAVNKGSGWSASPAVPTLAFAIFGN